MNDENYSWNSIKHKLLLLSLYVNRQITHKVDMTETHDKNSQSSRVSCNRSWVDYYYNISLYIKSSNKRMNDKLSKLFPQWLIISLKQASLENIMRRRVWPNKKFLLLSIKIDCCVFLQLRNLWKRYRLRLD